MIAVFPRRLIGNTQNIKIPFPIAINIIKNWDSTSRCLRRIRLQLGLAYVPWQFRVSDDIGEVEAGFEIRIDLIPDIREKPLIALFTVFAITI